MVIFKTEMSDEVRVLLLLSNPFFSENHRYEVKSLIMGNNTIAINMKLIAALARENEVAGFVFKNSRDLDIFPDRIRNSLHNIYRQTSFKNILILQETLAVLKLLSENDIVAAPLKGATVSDLLFNDFGVYPSSDVDILVYPSKLSDAKQILCSQGGFFQSQSIAEKDLLSDHYHLIFSNKTILLEVHWNLVKRYFTIPADFWWKESKEFQWNKTTSYELSIEKYILYNIFRLFDHGFYPLRFFILLKGIIDKNSEYIDWEKLFNAADQYRMNKLVAFTLKFIKKNLNTDIPKSWLKKKYFGYHYFEALILFGFSSGTQRKHQKMMFLTFLLIEPKSILTILIGRIFPSPGELRLRYNIPPESNRIYLYYFLNPFLLLLKQNIK